MGSPALIRETDSLEALSEHAGRAEPASMSPADSVRSTALVLGILTILYGVLIFDKIGRHLWFDELFTYYIAQEPTLPRLFDALAHTDLNPPLIYLLVRMFHASFGASELVTRIPVALAFYLGCVGAIFFLKRRIGIWWSAAAILLFWSTPYMKYATEARPYGLLIGFFSLVLIGYDRSGSDARRRWAVPCIAAGNIGMMLSHVFAPLSILPFCAAEAVRSFVRRRIDWAVWGALLLPLLGSFAYIPAARNFERIYFPQLYQASGLQLQYFFERLGLLYVFPGLPIALALAVVAMRFSSAQGKRAPWKWSWVAWAATTLATPAVLTCLLMRTGGAFWERYCITSALSFYLLVVAALAAMTGFRRNSAIAASLIFCTVSPVLPPRADSPIAPSRGLESIRHDLPFVAASGVTFLEMDHYQSSGFQSRLYYLVDRNAAIEFAHATVFENMPLLTKYFPIHGHVTAYASFVASHRHFLVLSRSDFIEEWLINKLRSDGARIRLAQTVPAPSKDFQLYDVQMGS
jgi:hypothetical protein